MRSFLIVTADDFGLHEAVNDAVGQAHRSGILTAASLMVAAPAASDAIRRAHDLPGLRVGLHLVLADGRAMLPRHLIPALVDAEGCFSNRMFMDGVRYFALPAVRRQLEAEIRAQFEAFARTGLVLDHVNAHKHFHLHPSLLGMIMTIGREFGMSALRVPSEPLWYSMHGAGATAAASAALLTPWIALMKWRLRERGLTYNDQVFGIASSGALNESKLLDILARLPMGITEIYLHPATATATPLTSSMASYRHSDELAALLSPKVRAAVETCRVPRGGYQDVTPASRLHGP